MPKTTLHGKELSTVDLDWSQVFYTNCGMVSASNVDQELTWCRTDFAAIGVEYAHLLSRRENDWYPHYIHNLDNLVRFGGLYPTIHVRPTSAARGCSARRLPTRAAACWCGQRTASTR